MEFDAAIEAAQAIIDTAPDHPAGYFYGAATYWQWRLITRNPQRRAPLLTQFQEYNRHTIQAAEQLPKTRAAETAFYLGAAYGMRARMYAIDKQYLRALRAAKQGGAFLQRCIELNPAWHDAYLGLGLYHYALARVPGIVRGVAQWLIGMKGDRLMGLQELERARTQGLFTKPEAMSLLAKIYASSTEKQYHKARNLLESLVQRYPQNFDYRYRLLVVSIRLQLWDRAHQLSHELAADIEQGKPYYSRRWLPLVYYRSAETYVLQGDHDTAVGILHRLYAQEIDASLRPWLSLRLGNVHDLRGDRQTAQVYYQQVTDNAAAEKLAARYATTPFTPQRIDIKPPEKIM
jgi:hypothetical protein